jgi:hypothetical protein
MPLEIDRSPKGAIDPPYRRARFDNLVSAGPLSPEADAGAALLGYPWSILTSPLREAAAGFPFS